MNPIAIFDKSFLHSLNPEEAAIFDVLFTSNITPVFYTETLADLEKEVRSGRTPEQVVGNLAAKTPRLHSYPNMNHWELCWRDLLGDTVQMELKPVVGGGRAVKISGKNGVVYDVSDEMKAFNRWQKGDFLGVERDFAKKWRPFIESAPRAGPIIISSGRELAFSNLDEVLKAAVRLVRADGSRWRTLKLAMTNLMLPDEARKLVVARWKKADGPPLYKFAPYAAFVFTINLFFETAISTGKISERASNRVDITYLYYLPFTELFISGDKLHRETVPLFLDKGQKFIWAPDLKVDLIALEQRYSAHPDIEKQGLMRIAAYPPQDIDSLAGQIYDQFRPEWRAMASKPSQPSKTPTQLKEEIAALKAAQTIGKGRPPWDRRAIEPDAVLFERDVPLRCGKFRFMPAGVEENKG